ncbi:MAG: MFS transporter [Bradyrhizobium sp.]|nr:MFS transporter [Bradyrhizobium sp.]MBU6463844.1 MFS transporter [Pseudomonadota bacterium]MDE2067599.1 MFS transporter [Bradyrhizobium sp.]MDE2241966.1 MFS transporter [Bradyrhizobium sp.]
MEDASVGLDRMADPPGNPKVLWISSLAFTLGFAVWGMFAALAPFLIKWYSFSVAQVLLLAAMEPLFAAAISIPLGVWTDKFGGRLVFTVLLLSMTISLFLGLYAESYYSFLLLGTALGLGGASFVVGAAHVSSWYPKSKQGTALGIFAMGNVGITVGMMTVTFLVTRVLEGPDGWRMIFPIFAVFTLLMALVYWFFTSDAPHQQHKGASLGEIVSVYRSGVVVWLVPCLYWVSFGTLTFFASFMPTYLVDRWHVDAARGTMVYTPLLVICVAITRPIGGWLADRFDVLTILSWMFGIMIVLALVMTMQISLHVELFTIYGLALLSGAAAAAVVKLIPLYFREVGAVSGLAKAAGAACGFTMTMILAASKNLLGGYTFGFAVWVLMNAGAFYITLSRVGFKHATPDTEAIPSGDDTDRSRSIQTSLPPSSARW